MKKNETDIRYYSATGNQGKTIIARLRPGSDFIMSLIDICEKYNIRNGFVPSCVGSLKRTRFTYGILNHKLKSGSGFSRVQETNYPVELLNAQGSICHDKSGKILIHIHAIYCDKGLLRGGHFDIPGNIVGTTMELVIQEVLEVSMTRPFDPEIDQNHLLPKEISDK